MKNLIFDSNSQERHVARGWTDDLRDPSTALGDQGSANIHGFFFVISTIDRYQFNDMGQSIHMFCKTRLMLFLYLRF